MDRDNVLYISNNKYVVIFNNLSHLKKNPFTYVNTMNTVSKARNIHNRNYII